MYAVSLLSAQYVRSFFSALCLPECALKWKTISCQKLSNTVIKSAYSIFLLWREVNADISTSPTAPSTTQSLRLIPYPGLINPALFDLTSKQKAIFIRVSCCGLIDQGGATDEGWGGGTLRQQHLKAYREEIQRGVHQGHSKSISARLRNLLYNPWSPRPFALQPEIGYTLTASTRPPHTLPPPLRRGPAAHSTNKTSWKIDLDASVAKITSWV